GHFFWQFALTIAVSTIISAFNSLTLSPALTALLLRPYHGDDEISTQGNKEVRKPDPLPRLSFVLLGGWLAWRYLNPVVLAAVRDRGWIDPHLLVTLSPCLLVCAGAAIGWFISRPVNRALGLLFRAFNFGFVKTTHGYTRVVGGLLRVGAI